MSELNIFGLREYTRKDLFEDTTDEIREADRFYIMHEADAVIADLIEKNERLSDDCLIKASNTFREIEKEIRHHEYKRCLAMADYCESQYHYYITLGNGFWLVRGDKMTRDTYHKRGEKFLTRWNKIWLALAEEPTWAKFLQLIHKETAKDGM